MTWYARAAIALLAYCALTAVMVVADSWPVTIGYWVACCAIGFWYGWTAA